jgi:AcrR family transcriptional regulator
MESVSQTASPAQLNHDQILDATLATLREQGYDATTIRRIARRLDCAIGSIYRYFHDKRQLLLAVGERMLLPALDEMKAGGSFERGVYLYTQLASRDCEPYRLMFWLACETSNGAMDEPGARLPGVVRQIIDIWGQRLGDKALAQRAWATVHGMIVLGMAPDAIRAVVSDQVRAATADNGHSPMAQIVTLLKTPPRRASETVAQPQPVRDPQPHAEPEPQPVAVRDDVTLL